MRFLLQGPSSDITDMHPQNAHFGRVSLISHYRPCRLSEDLCLHSSFLLLDKHENRHSYFCSWMWCVSAPQRRNSQVPRHFTTISHSCLNLDGFSMDFIIGVPKSGNKSVIMVVVNRLSKYAHFCALPHPFTPTLVAQSFMDQIFKLHGMPTSIVSDRDPIFTSNFWQELFKLQGTQLQLSTSYHPQTNGQTEAVNKCLENYLRCFTSKKKHQCVEWLPLAEWWYNTNYHVATKMTPCEAVYGQLPPSPTSYIPRCSKVQAVDQLLQNRATMLARLKDNLHQAQNHMKQ